MSSDRRIFVVGRLKGLRLPKKKTHTRVATGVKIGPRSRSYRGIGFSHLLCLSNSNKHGFPACTSPYVYKPNKRFNCKNNISFLSRPSPCTAHNKYFTVSWGQATLRLLQTAQSTRSTPHFQNANVSSQKVPTHKSIQSKQYNCIIHLRELTKSQNRNPLSTSSFGDFTPGNVSSHRSSAISFAT